LLDAAEMEIIRRCQSGDMDAFRWIFVKYESSLLRTAQRMLGNRPEAEDAVQNAFIKLYRGIAKFQFRSRFNTYLYRILINACLDLIARRPTMQKVDEQPRQILAAEAHEMRVTLEEAIARLPDRMRSCFVLFAIEDLPHAEIAEILQISVGGVKSTIFQARARLRACLYENDRKA
jgi:RNA polymerase sigma-70 factor, ECF subfamily